MMTPKVIGTKVVFGPCRLSYVYVFEKYNPENKPDGGKYMASVLIPKTEKQTLAAVRKAIEEARREAVVKKWGGKEPKKIDLPLRDGDDREKDIEDYEGHFYLNAKTSTRPGLVGKDRQPITDEEEIYSGVWAYVSVSFFGYSASGNTGVGCGLNNIMKFKDGDRMGGWVSPGSDFEGVDPEADTDDDDL